MRLNVKTSSMSVPNAASIVACGTPTSTPREPCCEYVAGSGLVSFSDCEAAHRDAVGGQVDRTFEALGARRPPSSCAGATRARLPKCFQEFERPQPVQTQS